jgi:diguanylate cyclase (GGDEF)-like protein
MQGNGKNQGEMAQPRVLIADDDAQFRSLLVRRAEKMGLAVTELEDGQQAVQALQRERFDLLVLDLYMPGFTGLEVVQQALARDPDMQAIILTGAATVETAVEALRSGVYDYLTKPLESLADFELTVNRALEHRRLILENKRLFAEVQRLAITDALTGLFNRRRLDEALSSEFERARRYKRPLSMIMLDMDSLKSINDTYGHPAGDTALKLVADAIRSQIRRVDLPARFGGDEFIVLLPEVDHSVAMRIAERIRTQLRPKKPTDDMFTVSGGVAQLQAEHASAEDLLRAVDQALYRAKREGGDCLRGDCPEDQPAGVVEGE